MKTLLISSILFSLTTFATEPKPPIVQLTDDQKVCDSVTDSELATYTRLINKFGGSVAEKQKLRRSEDGLQAFINQSGIRYFSAPEIMTPAQESEAIKCGLDNLIPPQCIWQNGAALMTIFERIRELIAGPIMFRNWWRPTCYNSLVDGAKASDHLLAKSFDVDFRKPHDRAVAAKFLCDELWKKGENIQIGIGCNSLHVGLASPKGKRFWIYSSMDNCPVKSIDNCWDL